MGGGLYCIDKGNVWEGVNMSKTQIDIYKIF